jgi:regulator of sigma E protease
MLTYIIPFIILILVVVFIHEYGHYYFARKYGVGVTDFSIGFGQELFGWNDKHGTDGRYVGSPLVVMSNFLEIVMFFHKRIMKKY